MTNVLVISQQSLSAKPIFKQDKSILEMCRILKEENNIKILYLHENLYDKENVEEKESDIATEKLDIEQVCISNMMEKNLFRKNLIEFITKNEIKTIVLTSYYMAKLVIPYIEKMLKDINIICDFRLSKISYILQQIYTEKNMSELSNTRRLYKNLKIEFLQAMAILRSIDYMILDEKSDLEFFKNEKITNIIKIDDINKYISKKNEIKDVSIDDSKSIYISINKNNYVSKENVINVKENEYIVIENKKSKVIDNINKIIYSNKTSKFVAIFVNRANILPNTFQLLIKYLCSNDKLAMCAPLTMYSSDQVYFKEQFIKQRNNNFSNWEEANPLSFLDCIVIKKEFFDKIGFFDNKFITFECALYDFILRLYQIGAYYCVMKDIPIFKSANTKKQISLFEEDKIYLCAKWGEKNFDMGI